MKALFSKIWMWILAHKIIAIVAASVLVVGTTCAIVLPIALHEHSYATEWSSDADNHWHDATCKHDEEKSALDAHTYTNACDTTCDVCGYTRTVGAHVYDNACDNKCNVCDAERTAGAHVYDNACDTKCNICGAAREITHAHGTTLTAGEATHYYLCSVCGDKKDEAAHVFDKTVASSEYLKAAATATTKAQYYKSCVCGKASATEYFETDKTTGTLANIQDLSKTYDKVELANPTYETNSDGVVTIEWYQGDTKLDAKPLNAGAYKVKVIIAESATYTGISAEKEFTIAKKVLSGLSVDLTYAGTNSFEVPLGSANGILASDVADGIKVCITFANKNVGATVTGAGLDAEDGNNFANYELDLTTCTANIVKRPVWAENVAFPYDGYDTFCGDEYPIFTLQNVVSGETIDLGDVSWCFDSKNVGATLTAVELSEEYNPNYTIDFSKCSASIVKRPVWAENVAFTYGGYTNWTGEESPNQIVFQNMANGETMDSSFVKWTFDSKNVGAMLASVTFVDEDDGRSNYTIDFSKCSASIVKKVLSGLEAEFVYNGSAVQTSPALVTANGVVAGDTDVVVKATFANKNAGASVTGAVLESASGAHNNYELDLTTCTASIVKKVLNNVTYNFTYNGSDYRQVALTSADHSGIIGSDEITLEVCFVDSIVGAAVDTSSPEMAPVFNDDNYELGTYSFSIVPKKLTLKAGETLSFSRDYRKTSSFAVTIDTSKLEGYVGTAAQMTVTATTSSDHAGTYDTGVILTPYTGNPSVKESQNYDFSEITTATMKINKAELVLRSYVTVEYNGTNNFTLTNYRLTSSNTGDGQGCSVYNGDVVYLDGFEVGTPDVTDETFANDYTLSGEDAENYYFNELGVEITPKEINPYDVVNDISSYTKVADGTNIFTFTLTEAYGIVAGDEVVLNLPLYADRYCEEEITAQGTYTDVYCMGATLTGADASNYKLNDDEPTMGQGYEATITAANP